MRKGRFVLPALVTLALACAVQPSQVSGRPGKPLLAAGVAHAGGGIAAGTYSNSLQALDRNFAQGYRLFEIDLSWTSDDRLVLMHDWDGFSFRQWFGEAGDRHPPSLEEFKKLEMNHGLVQLDLEGLCDWLLKHPGTHVITDVKLRHLEALERISRLGADLVPRFIPQIYDFAEFEEVRGLGFDKIILTLYRTSAPGAAVIAFAAEHDLFAVTMPYRRALFTDLSVRLAERGVFVYAHTTNSLDVWHRLRARAVGGVYSDFLTPAQLREPAPDAVD